MQGVPADRMLSTVTPMAEKHGNRKLPSAGGSLVDGLALSVISKVTSSPCESRSRRLEIATKLLMSAVLKRTPLDEDQIGTDLQALRIQPERYY